MNPLVQPDPGLFIWTILTFLVLVALLAKFAWRPLLEALERRQAAIAKSLEDAQKARQELERLNLEQQRMMAAARVEAEAIGRQPSASAQITGAVNLPQFLLEGVAILAEVFALLVLLLNQ
jgi:F-type H+-transporting ATPase subunit b